MNVHRRIFRSNMTSKCQVTIPKEIREALGLKAGDRVGFELTEDGHATIVPADREEALAARKARIMEGVREARQIYKAQGVSLGMSNAEFFDMMRGPPAEK
jgi:AbrB family looped-hinge helix DNA binding protein